MSGEDKTEELERKVLLALRGKEDAWQDATTGKPDDYVAQLYKKYLEAACTAHANVVQLQHDLKVQKEQAEKTLAEKQLEATKLKDDLLKFVAETASRAVDQRGRPLPSTMLEEFQQRTEELETELEKERTKNAKLRSTIRAQDQDMRRKEQMRDGLHLIDFEQLKIENQNFAQKIEDRNEEIARLKKSIDQKIQVVTHVKEKLKFVLEETGELKTQLADVDQKVLVARDKLSSIKQQRDALRATNIKLHQQNGLVGATELLKDYEAHRMALDEARARLDYLKRAYERLTTEGVAALSSSTSGSLAGSRAESPGLKLPSLRASRTDLAAPL